MVRSNSHEFEAQGRVLRLKQYISADVRPAAINAILEALAVNTLVEVLYIQNFEQVQDFFPAVSVSRTSVVNSVVCVVVKQCMHAPCTRDAQQQHH